MKTSRTLLAFAVCAALAGCSTPRPKEPDGSKRIAANAPERVAALQARISEDRELLTENNRLKAQLDELRSQLDEMRGVVKSVLTLPPAPPHAPARADMQDDERRAIPSQAPAEQPPKGKLARDGVVYLFYETGKTAFLPPPALEAVLRAEIEAQKAFEVRGYTDSNVINRHDRVIAFERAARAKKWLVSNGADPNRVRLRYRSAGGFIADNSTEDGRAVNRRVEIHARGTARRGGEA